MNIIKLFFLIVRAIYLLRIVRSKDLILSSIVSDVINNNDNKKKKLNVKRRIFMAVGLSLDLS